MYILERGTGYPFSSRKSALLPDVIQWEGKQTHIWRAVVSLVHFSHHMHIYDAHMLDISHACHPSAYK